MRLLRFERKIILALALVTLAPLAASVVLGRSVLRDSYEVGVNDRIRGQLEAGLDVYRRYFRAARREADVVADLVAARLALSPLCQREIDAEVRLLADEFPAVRELSVEQGRGRRCVELSNLGNVRGAERRLTLERAVPFPADRPGEEPRQDATLKLVIATDAEPFASYQQAGRVAEVYRSLEERADALSRTYWALYIACMMAVALIAGGLSVVASRRVTRRLAVLIDATKRVGRGDLSVAVPAGREDEIAELTGSFNEMVRALRHSQDRIDYLTRLSGWQEFAKRLAHEIKNPLTPIQLAAQEIERSFQGDDAKHRRALQEARTIIEEEVATLRRLVGDFSAFAKLPQVELNRSNLMDFLEELKTLPLSIQADLDEQVELRLTTPKARAPVPVDLDGMMLRRCFDNLFRNAAQAAKQAGMPVVELDVALDIDQDVVTLSVSDSGPGMDEATHQKVFQPHFTTKPEGSGLGLAIVKKVILEHGGDIICDSTVHRGARFVITLPLQPSGR